jgi:hypothetical protein
MMASTRRTGREFLVLALVALTPLVVSATTGAWQSDSRRADEAFRARVGAYVALQQGVAQAIPPLEETDDPTRLAAHQQALAATVRERRPGAREGDIFTADTAHLFRDVIADDFRMREPADTQALREDMPRRARLHVNDTYPADWPLATFPAALLARLPELPSVLEYRMVGRDLVLVDNAAGLVVDVLRDAVPD